MFTSEAAQLPLPFGDSIPILIPQGLEFFTEKRKNTNNYEEEDYDTDDPYSFGLGSYSLLL